MAELSGVTETYGLLNLKYLYRVLYRKILLTLAYYRHACVYNSIPSSQGDNAHFSLSPFTFSHPNSRVNFGLEFIKSPSHITWDLEKQIVFGPKTHKQYGNI